MTVRTKAIALVAATLIVALVSVRLAAETVLMPSYASLETRTVATNVEQTLRALEARLSVLDATNYDWASWDDTYEYALARDPDYVESNMVDSTFGTVGVNVMILLDPGGEVVYQKAYDYTDEQPMEVPSELLDRLSCSSELFQEAISAGGVSGILSISDGLLLVSVRPILTSEDEGPARGFFIMAQFLDEYVQQQIIEVTRTPLSLSQIAQSDAAIAAVAHAIPLSASDITVTPIDADLVEGSALIRDLNGTPVLRVTIHRDREIYSEGHHTISFFIVILAIGGAIISALALILADRVIFRRLSHLASEVLSIGELTDFSGEVTTGGNDEIAFLATAINETLSALARTHRQLHDSHVELEQTTEDLKRAQQEIGRTANRLRRLTRHLQSMREDERALVASEIHDQIGQGLAALKMDLSTLDKATERGEQLPPDFHRRMLGVADSLLETVRRLSSGLHPSMLEDLGLAEALEWQLTEYSNIKGIATSLNVQGPLGGLDAGHALTLFRILEEALRVSAEDPSVTEVSVTLTVENRYALLAMQDNGNATLEGDALSRREMGLTLIRERTEVYGGGATTTATPESGTTIVAQIPV